MAACAFRQFTCSLQRELNTMRQIIAGNWKMYGQLAGVTAYAEAIRAAPAHVDLLICPPVTLLDRFATALNGSAIALGAQDCHAAAEGAHTGDISAPMLV